MNKPKKSSTKKNTNSDADGLSDLQEDQLAENGFSYDKLKRRSFGVLDGICYLLGNNDTGACLGAQFGDSNLPPGFLMSDVNALGLSGSAGGLDTVGDFIPDIVKILFAVDPGRPLLSFGNDYDGDGTSDNDELRSGRSPLSSLDNNVDPRFLLKYIVERTSDENCESEQQAYEIIFEKMPLFLPTLAFEPSSDSFDSKLFHKSNENVFGVYYISETNDGQMPRIRQLWGSVYRSSTAGVVPVRLNPADFTLYGQW